MEKEIASMNPLDKLREDVQYWQEAVRTAKETLRVAESVLPGLESKLQELEPKELPPAPEPRTPEPEAGISPTPPGPPRFRGRQCSEQVLEALTWKPNQTTDDLLENLKKYGRPYGRGAIGYALRELKDKGQVVQWAKRGNQGIYRLTSQGDE
jgi:hypothetical protein